MNHSRNWLINHKEHLIVGVLFCIAIFFSTYKLTESPPTWMDEGMIVQASKTLVEEGVYAVKVAPDEYISPGFISTSYPVTFPIAFVFQLFGVGLLQARAVMVIYLLGFVLAVYFLSKRLFAIYKKGEIDWLTISAVALVISFPPLYGNGKNVLGEVPGLFFLTVFLIYIDRIWKGDKRISQYIIAGLMLGLCISTKPIFLLVGPVVALGTIGVWIWNRSFFGKNVLQNSTWQIGSAILPFIAWIMIQFRGDTLKDILSYYANPHSVDLSASLFSNVQAFFTAPQPLYFFLLWLIWLAAILWRFRSNNWKWKISASETIAFAFSTLVFAAYFRNPGFYRYFFLGEVFALIFLPVFFKSGRAIWLILLFVVFQFYQLFFTSWVSQYYGSTKARDCGLSISSISQMKSIYFYQDPELVIFRKGGNYYQFMDSIESESSRITKRKVIESAIPDYVIVSGDNGQKILSILSKYKKAGNCERYDIYKKIQPNEEQLASK